MLLLELFEARCNPEVNRKVSALDELLKYAGQKDVFVSFTHDVGTASHGFKGEVHVQRKAVAKGDAHNLKGAKIGINPTSDYNTPLGIYCYPVDYVIEKMEGGQSVEFGAERPYMWIFKSVGKVADLADYTQADLEEDCKKLGIDANDRFAKNVFRDALVHTPGGYFWAITRDKALNRARSKLQAEYEAKEDEREAAAQEKKDAAWDEFQTDYSNNKGIL